MSRWERGRITAIAHRSSWAILPIVHVGCHSRMSRGSRVQLSIGWLCFMATVRVY